jgi:hypothetical protein
MERWAEISSTEDAVVLDATSFCCTLPATTASPIDAVYRYIQSTIVLGQPAALAASPVLGRLLLLGFVSSVDDYFRRVLAGVVTVCPLARKNVSEQQVQFGALDYYDSSQGALALFEHTSFASLADIKKQTNNVAGVDLARNESVKTAIEAFEKLCHMRHASVHASGVLNSRNARALGLQGLHGVDIDFTALQTAARVCYSAVRAYNRWLFRAILEQWLGARVLTGVWGTDRQRFSALYSLFHSQDDDVAPRPAYNAFRALAPTLRTALGQVGA